MTDAERLEEIRARHPLEESGVDLCGQAWPCDAAVALAEVERLSSESSAAIGAAAKYLAEVERLRERSRLLEKLAFEFGGLHEMRFPVPVEMEHRYSKCVAALAELEGKG